MSKLVTTPKSVRISGTGSALPERRMTNVELAETIAIDPNWVEAQLGIRERRIAGPGEGTASLAARAVERALDCAKIGRDEVDMLIVATASSETTAPSTAAVVQDLLGLPPIPAFDIAGVCAGFLYALVTAAQFISGGMRHVVVVGADTFSRITDWRRRDAVFFGDGAGAVVLSANGGASDTPFKCLFRTDGGAQDYFRKRANEPYWHMRGRDIYELATVVLPDAVEDLLQACGRSVGEIDLVVPHQASIKVISEVARRTGIPMNRFRTNMATVANTVGGTLPILMDSLVCSGDLQAGMNVLYLAIGSGMTWGAALHQWS